MPTADDRDNMIENDTPEAVEPVAVPVAASQGVDEGRLAAGIVEGLRAYQMEREAATRNVPQQQAEERELIITDDDTAQVIAQKAAYNAGIPLRKQMAQMQQQFQTVGMGTLEQMARRSVLNDNPTYKKYKTEVDARLSTLDSVARANPDVLEQVVKMVRSDHVEDEVKERSERLVAAAIKAGEGASPGGSSGRSYRQAPNAGVPTPEDLGFSEEQINMIMRRGGPDNFAQKMSAGRYAGWDEYAKAELKAQAARKAVKKDTDAPGAQITFTRRGSKR